MTHNTKVSKIATMDWRILPGQDRRNGECITRKMTPEEWEKYSKITGSGRKPFPKIDFSKRKKKTEVDDMSKIEISNEQLIEICQEYGTGTEAAQIIAKKFGFTKRQAIALIGNRKIRDI